LLFTAALAGTKGVIEDCKRSLAMLEPDVVIYTNQITFMVDQDDIKNDEKVTFDYIVATDYKETLISVEAREFSSKAFQNTLEISKHQTEEYFWFAVDVTDGIKRS